MKAIQSIANGFVLFLSLFASSSFFAAEQAGLDAEIEELKADVMELNRKLFDLEEQVLYSATTSFAVF